MANVSLRSSSNQSMNQEEKAMEVVKFDEVVERLVPSFRYQTIHIIGFYLCFIPMVFTNLGFVFVAFEPSHVCTQTNETKLLVRYPSLDDIAYEMCQIKIMSNATGRLGNVAEIGCTNGHSYEGGKDVSMKTEWDLVCERRGVAEMTQTVFGVGSLAGSLIVTMLADRFGRKKIVVVIALANTAIELGVALSPTIYVIAVLKFFSGLTVVCLTLGPTVWGGELLVLRHRPVFFMVGGVWWTIVVTLLAAIAYAFRLNSWRDLQLTMAFLGLLPLVYTCLFLDESMAWLFARGRYDDALKILKKACRMNSISYSEAKGTFDECVRRAKINKNKGMSDGKRSRYNSMDIIRHSKLRKFTLVSCILWVTGNMSYYGLYLTSATIPGDRFLTVAVLALTEMLGFCLASVLTTRYNAKRRIFIASTYAFSAVSLLICACLASAKLYSEESGNALLVFFILGKMSLAVGYNVLFIYTPEMYPTTMRSTGLGICSCLSRVGGAIAPFLFPLFQIAPWAPGTILAAMCFVSCATVFLLPETSQRQLPMCVEDIDMWG